MKRLVVSTPGRGLGQRILNELMRIVFEEYGAHRFYLDVFEDNGRAQHVYGKAGFVKEGVMRDAAQRGGHYFPLYLMSILEGEYRR